MPREKTSVLYYTKATVNMPINFPENEINCSVCPFCRYDKELKIAWCDILGKFRCIMKEAEAAHYKFADCPLEFEDKEENQ